MYSLNIWSWRISSPKMAFHWTQYQRLHSVSHQQNWEPSSLERLFRPHSPEVKHHLRVNSWPDHPGLRPRQQEESHKPHLLRLRRRRIPAYTAPFPPHHILSRPDHHLRVIHPHRRAPWWTMVHLQSTRLIRPVPVNSLISMYDLNWMPAAASMSFTSSYVFYSALFCKKIRLQNILWFARSYALWLIVWMYAKGFPPI